MGFTLRSSFLRLWPSNCLYILYVCTYLSVSFTDVDIFDLLWKVLMNDSIHLGFTNGASRCTRNLASMAWVIYHPSSQLMVSRGVCIGLASNNISKYTTIINL